MSIPPPPIARTKTLVVNQNHPHADDANPGSPDRPFRSIGPAADLAEPGDRVVVHGGIYRERVAPKRGGEAGKPIVYEAAPGERVILRGSEPWHPDWEAIPDFPGVYFARLDPELVDAFNPYASALNSSPGRKTLGQVFVEGASLLELDRAADIYALPGSWMAVEEGTALLVHPPASSVPLETREVELTVRNRIFAPFKRGLGHITVRGFILEHCANDFPRGFWVTDTPQAGALGTRGGHHWVIENNVVRFAKTVGIDCGSEGRQDADGLDQAEPRGSGHHLIRNNVISDNGAAGIVGYRARNTRIIGNVLERNNRLGFTAPETAAMKFHFFTDSLIEGNLIRDNDTSGIWLDNVWHNSRVTRNVLISNQGAAIFIEMGYGPLLVDHNIIAFTRATTSLGGDGVYSHDAAGVVFAHNLLFFNANFGLWLHVATDRKVRKADGRSGEVSASNWRIVNNIMLGNHRGTLSLPLESDRSTGNISDGNLLAGPYDLLTQESHAMPMDPPVFLLNTNKGRQTPDPTEPLFLSLAEWREQTGQDRNSLYLHLLRPMLSTRSMNLDLIIDSRIVEIKTEVVDGVVDGIERDFFGTPMPKARPLPGPFQSMVFEDDLKGEGNPLPFRGPYNGVKGENMNRFLLWPLRVTDETGQIQTGTTIHEDFTRDF
ncbi:MAG: right-handed parallel beta-helix repeat-containing protein [Kiritimatiellae bacterium]|nr:right-handed parallel beta-helix repeat-containing protein [Kiritimatiellia bacterium]